MTIENKLKKLIEEQKEKSFVNPTQASDCDALGIMISQYLKWDGNEIFKTCYNAFEDANYHSLNEKFEELFKKMNHELSYKFDIEIKLIEKEVKKRAQIETPSQGGLEVNPQLMRSETKKGEKNDTQYIYTKTCCW